MTKLFVHAAFALSLCFATAAQAGDRAWLTELDFDFHRTVIEISGHRRLMEIYSRLESQTRLFLRLTEQSCPLEIVALREPLANAICMGDAEAAARLASRHADADPDPGV